MAIAWRAVSAPLSAFAVEPVRVIFDTDLCGDVDDVGAVAVLHALADRGEAVILAMGVSVTHRWSAPCLDALNTYYARPEIPIGVVKGAGVDAESKYAAAIAAEFPHALKSADAAPDAATLFRQTLAAQPDRSVTLITVGFLTNVAKLLDSGPDAASPLSGVDLARAKARCWVCMGGVFPRGSEWNLNQDPRAAQRAIEMWPAAIVFSGFEIGEPIETGAALGATPADNPVRRGYELFNGLKNRSSWDQTAVLYATRGLAGRFTDLWDLSSRGENQILPDGGNQWHAQPDRGHSYLVPKASAAEAAEAIELLMVAPPRRLARSQP